MAVQDKKEAIESLKSVIEKRVNLFGISEPNVQASSFEGKDRIIVELPGVTNVQEAIKTIGETPTLLFKIERPAGVEKDSIVKAYENYQKTKDTANPIFSPLLAQDPYFIDTPLTGRYLEHSLVEFDPTTQEPKVTLVFNAEGTKIFADMTKANLNKQIAIYLDGSSITAPVVREEIKDGKVVISGNFTPQEAKLLVGRLNSGALPVPITLVSTQVIGAPLGAKALGDGIYAGLIGLLAIAIFLIVWYRLPGVVAVLALTIYVMIMLLVFKLIPITLTAAGIAGFILSIGMAVDANILIAERTKEELRRGKDISTSINEGFARAWLSIRDSNISSIITGIILFWFGSSLIEGFALTFVLGVVVSMFSAITVTRTFLKALGIVSRTRLISFLFSSGFHKN